MLTKKILATGLSVAALAWSAVGLYGADTIVHPVEAQRCADGTCVPRRLTNGFYATTWRRWPVDPAARAKPGVREGISAPGMELPSPRIETYLPEGTLIAPPPVQDGGAEGGFESSPRDPSPPGPSPDPATPRGEPLEGVPPEFRSGQSRFPANKRPPQPMPSIAGRQINRPAAVIEALRSEAALDSEHATAHRAASSIPAALPIDTGAAQPLPPPPAVETPSIKPKPRSLSTSHSPRLDRDQDAQAEQRNDLPGRTIWSPKRTSHEVEQPTAGLNAPAAIHARLLVGDAGRPASRAGISVSAPASPAVLAVRTVSEQSWSQNSPQRNPLRTGSAVTKVSFEYSDAALSDSPPDLFSRTEKPSESAALEIPANPLRR